MRRNILFLIITSFSLGCLGQSKSILERKSLIYVDFEIPDAIFESANVIKPSVKLNLGYEKKLKINRSFTTKLMMNRFVTSPYTNDIKNGYEVHISDSTLRITPDQVSYSTQVGMDFCYKVYRQKKNAVFPVGKYFEFGIGLHNTHVDGFKTLVAHYDYNAENKTSIIYLDEKSFNITTASLTFSGGRQWLFDNNMLIGFGYRCRLHIPIIPSQLPDEAYSQFEPATHARYTYVQDLLLTDWVSFYVRAGFVL